MRPTGSNGGDRTRPGSGAAERGSRRVRRAAVRRTRAKLPPRDGVPAYGELERVGRIAERLGDGHNELNTEFGPTNVRLHEIAVAVKLGDAGRALRAATVDTSGLSAERQARMFVDGARAHAQRRQIGEAAAALVQAEAIHPRTDPGTRPGPPARLRPADHAGPARQ